MRELKFRVWSNFWKKYATEAELCMDGSVDAVFEDDGGVPHHENTDLVVEFKTGIKDKNGKEIYEGDIVEEKINTGDYGVDGTYRYKVVWDDDMLCWSLNPNSTSIHKDLWECNHSLKVIGNVHENPELLKG